MTNSIEKALENANQEKEKKPAASKHAAKPAAPKAEEVLKETISSIEELVEHLENPPAALEPAMTVDDREAVAKKAEPERAAPSVLAALVGAMFANIVTVMVTIGGIVSWPVRVMRKIRRSAAEPVTTRTTRGTRMATIAATAAVWIIAATAAGWLWIIAATAPVQTSVVDGAPLLDEGLFQRVKFGWAEKRVEMQVNRLDGKAAITAVREDGTTYAYDPARDGWVRRK